MDRLTLKALNFGIMYGSPALGIGPLPGLGVADAIEAVAKFPFHRSYYRTPAYVPPREWLRWVRGWTRGLGHRWSRSGSLVSCSSCEAVAGVSRSLVPQGPSYLRSNVLGLRDVGLPCREVRDRARDRAIRKVMES